MNLVLKKGINPYEYMDLFEKFAETRIPARDILYNLLNAEGLSTVEYDNAKKVWKTLGMKSMSKHHDLYLGLDVTLLADCLNLLWKVSKKTF